MQNDIHTLMHGGGGTMMMSFFSEGEVQEEPNEAARLQTMDIHLSEDPVKVQS